MTFVRASEISWLQPSGPALDLNGPTVPFRAFREEWVERPVAELFQSIAEEFGERIACEDLTERLTYAQVWAACRRLAPVIEDAAPAGQAVAVLLPNEAAYPVAILACLVANRPCVTIDRHYPEDRVAAIVRDAGVGAILLRRSDIAGGLLLPAGVRAVVIDEAFEDRPVPTLLPASYTPPDAASFVVYTSGSTGRPKGVAISQRAILHRVGQLINAVHFRPDDRLLSLASPSTIAGLQHIFEALLVGATLVKLDLQRTGLGKVVRAVGDLGVTMMFSTPAVWRSVARIDNVAPALSTLRCIHVSGDALLVVDLERLRRILPPDCHVHASYGATEAPAMLQWFVPPTLRMEGPRVPAGYLLPGFAAMLLDDSGEAVGPGQPGEFVVKSPWMSLGLWRDGAVHRGLFQQDGQDSSEPVYLTGDIASRDSDGLLVMLGRKDRQIKIQGNRVEPAEIEAVLRRMPEVEDAAVVARLVESEARLLAFVVPRGASSMVAVRESLKAKLPPHMQPFSLFEVEGLPLLPGRKIDEEALLGHAARSLSSGPGFVPTSAMARPTQRSLESVIDAWTHVLGRAPSQENQGFGAAGGNSLALLRLVLQLEQACGRALPLDRINGDPTPAELAMVLDRPSDATAVLPVVFFVSGRWGDTPLLARFRAACARGIRMVPLTYPDLRCLAHGDFEDIVAHLSAQIERAAPAGDILLAGYSLGGDFAYAVADRLLTRGRRISVLLVLDTNIEEYSLGSPPREHRGFMRRLSTLGRLVRDGDWGTIAEAILTPSVVTSPVGLRALRLLSAFPFQTYGRFLFGLNWHFRSALVEFHRGTWIRRAPAVRLDVPVVLFRSEEGGEDLGWRARTGNLSIVPVAGDHVSMLDPARSAALVAEFNSAVHNASKRPTTPVGR